MRDYLSFIDSGHLTYYRTTDFQYFSFPHSKNLSHTLASGDYVLNLDGDNFITEKAIDQILNLFEESPDAILKGFAGLIGLKKSHFLSLGGYDEDLKGWGYDENDLLSRAKVAGLLRLKVQFAISRIEHSDYERLTNIAPSVLKDFGAGEPTNIKWEMERRNRNLSINRINSGTIKANQNRIIGKANVVKNFSKEILQAGWRTNDEPQGENRAIFTGKCSE